MAERFNGSHRIVALGAFAAGYFVGKVISANSNPGQEEIVPSDSERDSQPAWEFDEQEGEPLFV